MSRYFLPNLVVLLGIFFLCVQETTAGGLELRRKEETPALCLEMLRVSHSFEEEFIFLICVMVIRDSSV